MDVYTRIGLAVLILSALLCLAMWIVCIRKGRTENLRSTSVAVVLISLIFSGALMRFGAEDYLREAESLSRMKMTTVADVWENRNGGDSTEGYVLVGSDGERYTIYADESVGPYLCGNKAYIMPVKDGYAFVSNDALARHGMDASVLSEGDE